MSSPTIMQVAVSSVNCGLNVNPSLVKNAIDFFRSFTGRFTKILVAMAAPSGFVPGSRSAAPEIDIHGADQPVRARRGREFSVSSSP